MNKYTNKILTLIAVALIGILFKGSIIPPAEASSVKHYRRLAIMTEDVQIIKADIQELKSICRN